MSVVIPVCRYFHFSGLLAVFCLLLLAVPTHAKAQEAAGIQSEIRLLQAARQDLLLQIDQLQHRLPIDKVQLDSLNAHLAWLDNRLAQVRQSMRSYRSNGGQPSTDPTQLNDRRAGTKKIHIEALPDEHAALSSLDEQLTQSIGTFDEHLLQETELAEQQAAQSSSQSSGQSSAAGAGQGEGQQTASTSGEGEGEGKNGERDGQTGESRSGAQTAGEGSDKKADQTQQGSQTASSQGHKKQSSSPGGRSGGGSRSPDKPIPSGDDDDIVARQLREAAERETDPELKERLWDEYRKYKKG